MQKIFEKIGCHSDEIISGPLNGYHKMRHNSAVTCQNQLEFWNQKAKTDFLIAVSEVWSLYQGFLQKVDSWEDFKKYAIVLEPQAVVFPIVFWKFLWEDKTLMKGTKL